LFAFQFFISLLTLSIIGQGDKLFIEKNFGLEKLGDYFYLANIFIFPYSMLQSYVGFKELVNFKKSFSKQFFKRKVQNINLMGVLLGFFLIAASWLGSEVGILKVNLREDIWLAVVFLMIGISKLNYAMLSSVFGAIGEVNSIFRANFQFLGISLLFVFALYNWMNSLLLVSLSILMLWIIRILVWNYNLFKQVNENSV